MVFVLDASVTVTWAFDDESDPVAEAAQTLMSTEAAIVPPLWWYEVRNSLLVGERRGRLREVDTAYFLGELAVLPIATDAGLDEATVFREARKHRLTFYDAAYLTLAMREGAALATLDAALVAAARAEGVGLVGRK